MPCPACGAPTGWVRGFHRRVVADVPVDGRRVVVSARVRRLFCQVLGRSRQTFREQVPGVVDHYQCRTSRRADQLGIVANELAGQAGARLSRVPAFTISRPNRAAHAHAQGDTAATRPACARPLTTSPGTVKEQGPQAAFGSRARGSRASARADRGRRSRRAGRANGGCT
ncbi:transposase family protein [Streptomyces sp. 6N106]|uniref:transposase family protein n=1 Tax=Streptomyces sp. 6N106 TaxID=3457418 RepID=UPI003FD30AEC